MMGREIRRVPPDWVHPTHLHQYQGRPLEEVPHPLFDEFFGDAVAEWERDKARWDADEPLDVSVATESGLLNSRSEIQQKYPDTKSFEEWHGERPDPNSYRDRQWTAEEATAYQVYETVSEGTPVSPVCSTREEMIAWLMTPHPEDRAFRDGMSREGAERFLGYGSAPSAVSSPGTGLVSGVEAIERGEL